MIDGGEKDDKIVAVPASKIDPTYDNIKELSDLPKIEVQRLESFFRVYKDLPEGRKKVELNGFNDAATAKQRDQTGPGCPERENRSNKWYAGWQKVYPAFTFIRYRHPAKRLRRREISTLFGPSACNSGFEV